MNYTILTQPEIRMLMEGEKRIVQRRILNVDAQFKERFNMQENITDGRSTIRRAADRMIHENNQPKE